MSNTEWIEINRDALTGDLETRVQALLEEAFPEGSSTNGDYYAFHGVPDRILIAREARQVVGHLALYQRQVKMGDEVLEIGIDDPAGGVLDQAGDQFRLRWPAWVRRPKPAGSASAS